MNILSVRDPSLPFLSSILRISGRSTGPWDLMQFVDLVELEQCYRLDSKWQFFDAWDYISWLPRVDDGKTWTQSPRNLTGEVLCEEICWSWRLDGPRKHVTCSTVEKFARPLHLKSARVFENSPKPISVALHRDDAHIDDIYKFGNTKDDFGFPSYERVSRRSVESWKVGPGRKKDWRTAPCLRFANKDVIRLLRRFQQKEAALRSRPFHSQDSEFIPLITQALISSKIPKVMLEHTMAGQNRSRKYPKPSTMKSFARRLGIPTSNMRWPRTWSKQLSPKAAGLIHVDGADDEELDDDSFEPGSSDGFFGSNLFSDTGNDM